MSIADALREVLVTPNEADSNWEPANVVDGMFRLARAIEELADAIRPPDAVSGGS